MSFPSFKNCEAIGFDTETTGLQYPVDKAFGFSVATPDWAMYWDIREQPEAVEWFNHEMRQYKGIIAAHNCSFDYRMSHSAGMFLHIDQLDDTVNRACQINEHLMSYDLDSVAKKYLGAEKESEMYEDLAKVFGGRATRNVQMKNIAKAEPKIVRPYAEKDARLVLDLWRWQEKEIERQGLRSICDFERRTMPTIIRAEMRGVRVDTSVAEEAAHEVRKDTKVLQRELNKLAGGELNVNSTPQIKKLFNPVQRKDGQWYVGNNLIGKTNSGGPSLSKEYLINMADKGDRRAELIQDVRSQIKTADTFLMGHICSHAIDGRVYPTINQNKGEDGGTGTGRLSVTKPAMQQIPSRNKKIAAIVKPAFLPDEGRVWVDSDMASFEVRVFAHLVNNQEVIKGYTDDNWMDLHQYVADITGLPRNATYSGEANAKQLDLSMIFNSGNGAIAEKMGMPWEWNSFKAKDGKTITYKKAGPEAEAIIEKYHKRLPGVKKLANGAKKKAESRGYVFTRYGRHLRFPKGYKSYKASGLLIQATAADINKRVWSIIEEELGDEGHLILNTHDSYSMCMPEDWGPHYKRVKEAIQDGFPWFRVPLMLEFSGAGGNWWDAINKSESNKTLQKIWNT
jgi:DNA polymerase I-like protein with 3'-5' exonuclease and polymerase domains